MPTHPQPPRIGQWLLRLCPLGARRQEVETDLLELFRIRAANGSRAFARRRYLADVLSLWTWHSAGSMPAAEPRYEGFGAMRQDLVFATRLFRRQPLLFGLTVTGLAVAMGISTATFSIVRRVAFAGYGVSGPESVVRVALIGGPFSKVTGNSAYQGNWAFSDYARLKEAATSMNTIEISARIAREFWGQEEPLGASLERVWGSDDASIARLPGLLSKPKGTRIIGVVTDVVSGLRHFDAPTIYLPLADSSIPRLVVRAHGDPHVIAPVVRDALETLDPTIRARTMFTADGLKREREGPRILAALAVMVGSIALGLAIIGLFGVTAFAVEQRTHEVSVRRALGASNGQLMRMLFNESLTPVAMGLTLGLLLALLGGGVIQSVLYGINSRDPIAIGAALTILLTAAAAAVALPARRATSVDPAQLLKMV